MLTIKVKQDPHGYSLNGAGRVRYLSKGLVGTVCESVTIREIVCRTKMAASVCPMRAPGDWPAVHGQIERRIFHGGELPAEPF